jgi:hypothetical protein
VAAGQIIAGAEERVHAAETQAGAGLSGIFGGGEGVGTSVMIPFKCPKFSNPAHRTRR